ncbi:MAG: FAD-dependent oxidoreductase [Planctomycetes bacterium]|nr:FAD-dependent oxidoreductase [Planctomycetota bacterium]
MSRYPVPQDRSEAAFAERYPLLSSAEARAEAARCLYCFDAPCVQRCPTEIDIPSFIRSIGTDNLRGAARTILDANLLGDSCARVCPVEVLCQSTCVYVHQGRPAIPIGRLQRYAMAHGMAPDILQPASPSGRSVGLVGAGPASLACAGALALRGHAPVIYERDTWPGGLNATGIAPYKFQITDNLREVAFIESLGVEIRTGVEIGGDLGPDRLLAQHDALFLGIGLGPDRRLGVPGEDRPQVVGATHWIRRLKTDPGFRVDGVRRAVVVGGGNTAVDTARELLVLGVPSVQLVYRRGRPDMSGYDHELGPALADHRLQLIEHVNVVEVLDARRGVEVLLGDHSGTLASVPADLVVVAIGQARLDRWARAFPGVTCDDRGRIEVDPHTMATGNPRVFAGGDAVNGGKEVVHAVRDGQRAARAIDALLQEVAGA